MGISSGWATITLPVHPQCGEKVNVLGSFGSDMVQVELTDGRLRLMPVSWTSLHPPRTAEACGKRPLFELEALRTLANWVSARAKPGAPDCRKLDHFDKSQENVVPDGARREAPVGTTTVGGPGRGRASNTGKHRATAAVVEQTRPSRPRGRSRRDPQRK